MKQRLIHKLTSRKFILAMLTAIVGIATMIVGENAVVQILTGAATTIVPTVVYCVMEGKIDAQSVKTITDAAVDAAERLGADEKTVDVLEGLGEIGEILAEEE